MIDKRVYLLVSTIVRVVEAESHPLIMLCDGRLNEGALNTSNSKSAETRGDRDKSAKQRRVLVVDDEKVIADSVAMILKRHGYAAEAMYSGRAALESIQERCPDIIVSDVVMPDLNGIQLARAIRSLCARARIVLFSGNVDTASLLNDASMEGHLFEILAKPVHPVTLLKALEED